MAGFFTVQETRNKIDESKRNAIAIVPEDQLSLAIGQKGQNVRLAAKLTGWKIDVKSDKAFEEERKAGKKVKKDEKEAKEVPLEDEKTKIKKTKKTKTKKSEKEKTDKETSEKKTDKEG